MFAVHPEKSFVPAFFKVYIEHLFDNLESEKKKVLFWKKKSEKSLELLIQKSLRTLYGGFLV